jgi:hypothetical protein
MIKRFTVNSFCNNILVYVSSLVDIYVHTADEHRASEICKEA